MVHCPYCREVCIDKPCDCKGQRLESRVAELEDRLSEHRLYQIEICMALGIPTSPDDAKDHAMIIDAINRI